MKDTVDHRAGRLVARAAPALPVEKLLIGKPVAEAAALLPRLFNLCRAAQEVAVARALDLPTPDADVGAEITRDHLLKLFVSLPGHFGTSPRLSPTLFGDPQAAVQALFGARGVPETAEAMTQFLASGQGIAPLLSRIAGCFGPGEATVGDLPLVTAANALTRAPVENSPAGRRASHPGLRIIESLHGRGPLWRVTGRALDLAMTLDGDLPSPTSPTKGTAIVPATRGTYAIKAETADGQISAFARVTPTDHLLAPGGVLDQTLATLPADRAGLAPLILDILDPCSPVRLEQPEVAHA
ncbi:MAG: hydrogenase expression/formation protein HupK [Pseudomonadota bacterium]